MKDKIEINIPEGYTAELKNNEIIFNKIVKKWQDKLIQPKDGDYYFISSNICKGLRAGKGYGLMGRKPEHAFRTAEQCELMVEKFLLHMEMAAFAHVKNEGWKPDWKYRLETKWGIVIKWNITNVELRDFDGNDFVFGIAVKSKEIAKEMYEIFSERIKKYYNEQY